MTQKRSFRVYFIVHVGGRRTGVLMRTWDSCFDSPAPSAIGSSEDDVLSQLEVLLAEIEASSSDAVNRYLWEESFQTREVPVLVHPQTAVKKQMVVGQREIPLRLTYAFCLMKNGGFRVMLPRFGWWMVLESLAIAPEVLRSAIAAALVGENAGWIYDFRREGDEYVREWSPRIAQAAAEREGDPDAKSWPTVRAVCDDLVERSARGSLTAAVGDCDEFTRATGLFERSPRPSILLVGAAGVGKSTFVRRMARWLVQRRKTVTDEVPARLWGTSAQRLIAGMVYVGMWQERCLKIVRELGHEGHWLYVDRLVPTLQPQSDGASIGEILAPAMIRGEISVVAECTQAEYERCRRRFPAMLESFQVLRLEEPSRPRVGELMELYQSRKGDGTSFHPAGLRRLIHHLATFQRDAAFPGKGLKFLDWIHAGAEARGARVLYPKEVSELYASHTGLPVELISDERQVGGDLALAAVLKRSVIGQDRACEVSSRVLARFKAGLNDPDRPLGTLLFVGPTGVGKTELARTIARFVFGDESRMIRVDMSEYMFGGSAGRLLETSGGAQSLAQRVREQPLSLVLLDEIEKAHPEVFDLLLGVLGEGRLTDSFGAVVDFRMSLVVMTSNLGATELRPTGFGETSVDDSMRAVRDHFRPEFFNRLDHVIPFRQLSPEDVLRIVDLELDKAAGRTGLLRRNLKLVVTTEARRLLATEGFHPTRGARPLKRVIEDRVVAPLAALLARDPSVRDRSVRVGARADDPAGIALRLV